VKLFLTRCLAFVLYLRRAVSWCSRASCLCTNWSWRGDCLFFFFFFFFFFFYLCASLSFLFFFLWLVLAAVFFIPRAGFGVGMRMFVIHGDSNAGTEEYVKTRHVSIPQRCGDQHMRIKMRTATAAQYPVLHRAKSVAHQRGWSRVLSSDSTSCLASVALRLSCLEAREHLSSAAGNLATPGT
jgi:hypothetical protein